MHVFGLIFLLLALGGCSPELSRVKAENEALREQVNQLQHSNLVANERLNRDYAVRMAEFEKSEHLAGITQGCRVIFNLCPATMTAPGDEAIKNGASGAFTVTYWTMLFLKACFLLGVIFSAVAFWSWRLKPDLTAKTRLDQELAEATDALNKMHQKHMEMVISHTHADRLKKKADAQLLEIQGEVSAALKERDAIKKEIFEAQQRVVQKEAAVRALGAFNQ
jgi:DNA repair exonuclease SbcCD ATPase subunit